MKTKDLMMPLQEHLKSETTLRKAANSLGTTKRGYAGSGIKGGLNL